MDAYLTVAELGELLKLPPRTVRRRVKAEGWPHWGEGSGMRFSPDDVAAIDALHRPVPQDSPPVPAVDLAVAISGIKRLNRHAASR